MNTEHQNRALYLTLSFLVLQGAIQKNYPRVFYSPTNANQNIDDTFPAPVLHVHTYYMQVRNQHIWLFQANISDGRKRCTFSSLNG